MLGFRIQLARDPHPVSDLISPDGCRRVRILLAIDFAIVKALVFQLLLRRFDGTIRPRDRRERQKADSGDE
jgi:hypothetical protein